MQLPDDPLSVFSRSVFTANGLLLRAGEDIAKQLNQSTARWHVLGRANHKPRTVSAIAQYIGVSRQNVQRIANDLQKEGLIAYEPNPHDKRAQLVTITPRGKAVLRELYDKDADWSAQTTKDLDAEQLLQLSKALDAISDVLAKHLGLHSHDKA
jgi:DNA-binding MarR family transcriptional regulator